MFELQVLCCLVYCLLDPSFRAKVGLEVGLDPIQVGPGDASKGLLKTIDAPSQSTLRESCVVIFSPSKKPYCGARPTAWRCDDGFGNQAYVKPLPMSSFRFIAGSLHAWELFGPRTQPALLSFQGVAESATQ